MSKVSEEKVREAVEEHYTGLYRFGYHLASNPFDAEDLVQETFLQYARKGGGIREEDKTKSWLFTTLYRAFLKKVRKGKRESVTDKVEGIWVDDTETPDEALLRKVSIEQIRDSLMSIDTVYRAPLSLFFLESLSYQDIAERLDIPMGTVMSRLSRGKALLKRKLLALRE